MDPGLCANACKALSNMMLSEPLPRAAALSAAVPRALADTFAAHRINAAVRVPAQRALAALGYNDDGRSLEEVAAAEAAAAEAARVAAVAADAERAAAYAERAAAFEVAYAAAGAAAPPPAAPAACLVCFTTFPPADAAELGAGSPIVMGACGHALCLFCATQALREPLLEVVNSPSPDTAYLRPPPPGGAVPLPGLFCPKCAESTTARRAAADLHWGT